MKLLKKFLLTVLLEFEPFPSVIAQLQSALMALGTGECQVNQCEGCKYDSQEGAHQIRDALKRLNVEPWGRDRVNMHSSLHQGTPKWWKSQW